MGKIKNRETVQDIKILDRGAVLRDRARDVVARGKSQGRRLAGEEGQESSEAYAADNVQGTLEEGAGDVVHGVGSVGHRTVERGRGACRARKAERVAPKAAFSGGGAPVQNEKGKLRTGRKWIKTRVYVPKETRTATKGAATFARETAAALTRGMVIRTQTLRKGARVSASALSTMARGAGAAAKGVAAGSKVVATALTAGGLTAVLMVIVISLVGLVVGSCFGIFFSGEDNGSERTMREVVEEINGEYLSQLDRLKAENTHDQLRMTGSRAVWPQVLAVYAVKTATDPDNPQEVATLTEEKEEMLEEIFWAMNRIDYALEVRTETEIQESEDGSGGIVEEEVEVTKTYLTITVDHRTAEEMGAEYGFTEDQLGQLAQLLDEENNSLWASVLYGIDTGSQQLVAVALSQVGNVGGAPYWSWYGFASRVEWCACFVSWCANECGYIENGILPKFAGCVNGVNWFREQGQWEDNSVEPTPGMIIFFDWDDPGGLSGPQDGLSDHVGIVEKVENGRVYTIEGNSGDACRQRSYPVGHYEILGYGILGV